MFIAKVRPALEVLTICSKELVTLDEFRQNRKSCAALIFLISEGPVESAVTQDAPEKALENKPGLASRQAASDG